MLGSHHRVNSSLLRWSLTAQSTGMLNELGKRLVETTRDVRAFSFLFQLSSVVVQRFNSVLLHDGFIDDDRPE